MAGGGICQVLKQQCRSGTVYRRHIAESRGEQVAYTCRVSAGQQRDGGRDEGEDVGEEVPCTMGRSVWEASHCRRHGPRRDATEGVIFGHHVLSEIGKVRTEKRTYFEYQIPDPKMGPCSSSLIILFTNGKAAGSFLGPESGT